MTIGVSSICRCSTDKGKRLVHLLRISCNDLAYRLVDRPLSLKVTDVNIFLFTVAVTEQVVELEKTNSRLIQNA